MGAYLITTDDWNSATFGDTHQLIIEDVTIPASGGIYFNLHLDYDLKRTTGYMPSENVNYGWP
jgi:hypothetical protein